MAGNDHHHHNQPSSWLIYKFWILLLLLLCIFMYVKRELKLVKYKSLPIVPAHIIQRSEYPPTIQYWIWRVYIFLMKKKDDDETDFNQTFLNLEIERNFFSAFVYCKNKISWYANSLRLIHEWENFYMKIIDMSLKGIHLPQLIWIWCNQGWYVIWDFCP